MSDPMASYEFNSESLYDAAMKDLTQNGEKNCITLSNNIHKSVEWISR